MWMLDNDTYPLKDHLKMMGFKYDWIDGGFKIWQAAQDQISIKTVENFLEQWGWTYNFYSKTIDTEAQ